MNTNKKQYLSPVTSFRAVRCRNEILGVSDYGTLGEAGAAGAEASYNRYNTDF